MLATDWENPGQSRDVNDDLFVSPLDALIGINRLNTVGPGPLGARDIDSVEPYYDVNGDDSHSPIDVLLIFNGLNDSDVFVGVRLATDTAPAGAVNRDRISSDPAMRVVVSQGGNASGIATLKGGFGDTDPQNFVDVTTAGIGDESLLDRSALETIHGGPLSDGDYVLHLQSTTVGSKSEITSLSFTIDATAPTGSLDVDVTVRQATSRLFVDYSEQLEPSAYDRASYELQVAGGPNDGQAIEITNVDSLNEGRAVRFNLSKTLPDQGYVFRVTRPLFDTAGNQLQVVSPVNFAIADPTGIDELSPASGEKLVSVTRETIIRFDEKIDPASITGGGNTLTIAAAPVASAPIVPPIHLIANGELIAGRVVVSSTERFATFFYDNPLPASTEVRITVDGSRIIGRDGLALDADGDNEPGGRLTSEFRTLPLNPIPATNIFGFVKDSSTGEPVVGATIRVDALPANNVLTDETGRFELMNLPAPEVFVHIDGTTATNLPGGFIYPNVGKPFHTVAGQTVQLEMAGQPFDIFLPRLKESDIQDLSSTATTAVGFGDDGKARLAEMFPTVDPAMFDRFVLSIEPGSAVDEQGNPATRAAIVPVEPSRIPAPLPSFLNPMLVVSIQTPGATNFDVPAEITFPNLEGLEPGEKAQIFSFDHDRGEWKFVGTGTVTPDGMAIASDGGVIQAPGWHEVESGSPVVSKFGRQDNQQRPTLTVAGMNTLFTNTKNKSQITITNNSNVGATVKVTFDKIGTFTNTSIDTSILPIPARQTKTIDLTARSVTAADIEALQDDDPNTTHAEIFTGTIRVESDFMGETLVDETYLYGIVVAEDHHLAFPPALDEEESAQAAQEDKTILLTVNGPVNQLTFAGDDEDITFEKTGDKATFTVPAIELTDVVQRPSGQLTLSNGGESLPTVPVNAADAIQLDPFAIRRVSGEISGDVGGDFTISGKVEVGLAGATFDPLFAIEGNLEIRKQQQEFFLSGKVTTNLLRDILGFGEDVVLLSGTALKIDRATKKFTLFPKRDTVQTGPPAPKDFNLAGMRFSINDIFIPDTGFGLGVRGAITLPDKLGNVKIDIGSGANADNAVLITTNGIDVTGALIEFPPQRFTIFGVKAEAKQLSFEFQKRGIDDMGVPRGNRLLLRGTLDLIFPKLNDLRIRAAFAPMPADDSSFPNLPAALGKAWEFALLEEPELQRIGADTSNPPETEEQTDDGFIRLEFKPDGTSGLDAVGIILVEKVPITQVVTLDTAFLQLDTVNDNYFGFARVSTSLKRVGAFSALLGIEGGELDLIGVAAERLNPPTGIAIGTPPTLFLQSLGGGVKDLTEGREGAELIAALTATLGPATEMLSLKLPDFLGGQTFGGNLLQIDVGGNIGLQGLSLGGQIVVGGDENGGLITGIGKLNVNFNKGTVKAEARLETLGNVLTITGLNGGEFATLTANTNFDISANGTATARLPDELPTLISFAEGFQLGGASAAIEITRDGDSRNDFIAFWGTGPNINPFPFGGPIEPTVGLQVFLTFPPSFNVITSLREANRIANGLSGEGEEGDVADTATFVIPADEDIVFFTTTWVNESTTAMIELVDPSGTVITEADIDANPNVGVSNSSNRKRTIAVNAPAAGEWTVRLVGETAATLGTSEIVALLNGVAPTVALTAATVDGTTLDVAFATTDASESANVSIFLDTDQAGFDGILLAADVPVAANGTGSTSIDLSGLDLPGGDYFVYARLEDPGQPLVLTNYSDVGFTITDPAALPAVSNVQAAWIGGNQVEVSWDELAGAASYSIRLTDDAAGAGFQQSVDVLGDGTSLTLRDEFLDMPLVAGETYRIEIVGIDSEGNVGSRGGRTVVIVGSEQTIVPELGQFEVFAVPGTTYSGTVNLAVGETAALMSGPAGSTVDTNSGLFQWDVPAAASGFVDISIKITPATGLNRFEHFVLFAAPIPMIMLPAPPTAAITGSVLHDTDFDGVSDVPLAGVRVSLDAEHIATTDSSGAYRFENLAAGDYDVMVELPADFAALDPLTFAVTLADDEQHAASDIALVLSPGNPATDFPDARLRAVDSTAIVYRQLSFPTLLADGVGGEMATINLELLNFGTSNLVIDSVQIVDVDSGITIGGLTAGTTILPDGFETASSAVPFTLTFDPTHSGDVVTQLVINSNDPASPLVIDLFAGATADGPELRITTANNNAGGAIVGQTTTKTGLVALTNVGSQDLSITAIVGSLGFTPSNLPLDLPAQPIVLAPGEAFDLDIAISPSNAGLQGGLLQVVSDDVNQPTKTRSFVFTGVGGNAPQAQLGNDFVAIHTPARPNSPVLRAVSGPSGEFEFILAANAAYEVTVFDPVTGLVAKALDVTQASGNVTDVDQPDFFASTSPDTDGDTLPDDIEFAIGTSAALRDTDNDGMSDFDEIQQGLDPLSGFVVTTGVVASVPLLGESKEVVLTGFAANPNERLAFLATGSHGLAAVDVTSILDPVVLGQLDLPGVATDIDVDPALGLAAVAAGSGGLHIVDVSDPMLPVLLRTVNIGASRVEVFAGVAYVVGGNTLAGIDIATGTILQAVTGGSFTDVDQLGSFLYTMETENNLRVFEVNGLTINARGSLALTNGGGRLFVGGGVAYVPASDFLRGGFSTVDINDPDNPALISGTDVTSPNIAPGDNVVPNGSGLALVTGTPGSNPVLDVVDVSDPANTEIFADTFRTRIPLPSAAADVAIGGGIAFVAGSLHVVNYLAFDDGQVPPTISLGLPDIDVDAGTSGVQVLEGTAVPLDVDVTDDVQIRGVELLVNGQVVLNDISFPFDLTTIVPALPAGSTSGVLLLQARATDTGGNVGLSNLLMLDIVEDTIAPTIDSISPVDGSTIDAGFVAIRIEFSEPMAGGTINSTNLRLTNSLDEPVAPLSILISPDQTAVRFTYQLQAVDNFDFTIDASNVADRAGNPLGTQAIVTSFQTQLPRSDPTRLFPNIIVPRVVVPETVSVSDFNNDGIADLAVLDIGKLTPVVSILLGRGNATYDEPVDFAVGNNPRELQAADLNNDGNIDLVVIGLNTNVSVLLGLGDGTLAPQSLLPLPARPDGLAVGDINNDGNPDILTTRALFGGVTLDVHLGNGDGSFAALLSDTLGSAGPQITLGNFNGDDLLDVAVNGRVVLSNGDGTFGDPLSFPAGNSIAVGHFNNDQHLDLVRDNFNNTVSLLLGNGDGTFAAPRNFAAGKNVLGELVVADFDNDGTSDVVRLNIEEFSGTALVSTLSVLLGDGDGNLSPETRFDLTGIPYRLAQGDVNGDGNIDLLLTGNNLSGVGPLAILIGRGDGAFQTQQRVLAGFDPSDPGEPILGPVAVAIRDVDGNGTLDVITANQSVGDISLLSGNGDGTVAEQVRFDVGGQPIAIVVEDFNHDDKLDVLTASQGTDDISVLLGDGLGGFASNITSPVGFGPASLAHADLNGDTELDLVLGSFNTAQIATLLGNGDGTFGASMTFDVGPPASGFPSILSLALGDVNGDGNLDVVTVNRGFAGDNITSLLLGNGDGTFEAGTQIAEVTGAISVTLSDINSDSVVDLLAGTNVSGKSQVAVLLGQSDGTFGDALLFPVGNAPRSVSAVDVNGDAILDIVTANRDSDDISVLIGNGSGGFAPELRFGVGREPLHIAFADLDGKGGIDAVVANSESRDISILLNQASSAAAEGEAPSALPTVFASFSLVGFDARTRHPASHVSRDPEVGERSESGSRPFPCAPAGSAEPTRQFHSFIHDWEAESLLDDELLDALVLIACGTAPAPAESR